MSNQIKKEELETLQNHVQTESKLLYNVGALENQKFIALHALNQCQQKLQEHKKELEDKYGKVNINISDGTYEEIKEEQNEEEFKPLVDEYIR
tara:strand:- start:894 stop:1172 length:279 start_codon:yes stop_codon:yes gene_type:complete